MKKVPVSEKALYQRINRKLKKDYKRLCKSRPGSEKSNLGTYHIVDVYNNTVIDSRIEDIEELARENKVIAENEYMKE